MTFSVREQHCGPCSTPDGATAAGSCPADTAAHQPLLYLGRSVGLGGCAHTTHRHELCDSSPRTRRFGGSCRCLRCRDAWEWGAAPGLVQNQRLLHLERASATCCASRPSTCAPSDLLVLGWRAGSPCDNLTGLLEASKSISLIYLGDYSVLLGRSGAQGGWRRFNPGDKRKPSKRLIAGLCILCSVAAHVTAAMPSAQHSSLPCIIHQLRMSVFG